MRVLHVDTAREWRGGQTQLLHLARGCAGEVAVALPPDAALRPALEAAGVTVLPVPFGAVRGARGLHAALAAFRPDVVAAHTSHAHGHAVLGALAGPRLPVVVHRRLDFVPGWLSRPKYRLPTRFVAVSLAVAGVLAGVGVPRDRIAVVLDGVDPGPLDAAVADPDGVRHELGWPAGAPTLLAVGALVAHKGHRVLLDALARTAAPVRVVICGEGPLRTALEAQVRRLGLTDRVRLAGHRADVPRLLRSLDGLVHPSLEEGMGSAVAEAAIAGAPIVASRAGGVPEVVGEAGALVPVGDPSALAAALDALVADRSTARERARAAAPGARDRHAVARMVSGTMEAYRVALAR